MVHSRLHLQDFNQSWLSSYTLWIVTLFPIYPVICYSASLNVQTGWITGSTQPIRTSGLGPILPMGASPCLDVMYDRHFAKVQACLASEFDRILLYWHHDCKILPTPPWQMALAELWPVRVRLTLQVVVYDEYTDGPRWCSQTQLTDRHINDVKFLSDVLTYSTGSFISNILIMCHLSLVNL